MSTKEYIIPGLGLAYVKPSSLSSKLYVEFELTPDDLERLGAREIVVLSSCGGCDRPSPAGFEGDYLCVECREAQGDISFHCTLDKQPESL